ncbi:MAG: hypothetical protein ACJ76H_07015 [Bacteriovoracaceae bacterium]
MKFSLIVLSSLLSLSAFAGSRQCVNEVKAAAHAITAVNRPGQTIQTSKTRATVIQTDRRNAGTIGLIEYVYDVEVGAKDSVYQITVDQEMGACDIIKIERSLDNSVG